MHLLPKKLQLEVVSTPSPQLEAIKLLFQEYQQGLGVPIDFQNFEAELQALPGKYASPQGMLCLASWQGEDGIEPIGCFGLYPMGETDVCELKRLFLKPAHQGQGLGKALMAHALQEAKRLGYQKLRLDSLRRLEAAFKLYQHFDFYEIEPYNNNPHLDVYYMERPL
jgi:putative acetyltransferase